MQGHVYVLLHTHTRALAHSVKSSLVVFLSSNTAVLMHLSESMIRSHLLHLPFLLQFELILSV